MSSQRKEEPEPVLPEERNDFPVSQSHLIEDYKDIEHLLGSACYNEKMAVLLFNYNVTAVKAKFISASSGRVLLEPYGIDRSELPLMASCCLYFNTLDNACSFLSYVRDCRPMEKAKDRLLLEIGMRVRGNHASKKYLPYSLDGRQWGRGQGCRQRLCRFPARPERQHGRSFSEFRIGKASHRGGR